MTSARLCATVFLLALSLPFASSSFAEQPAEPVGIRGDFSGHWFNPAQSGQGLFVEVLDRGRAALGWYTFDPAGQPQWLVGLLDVQGARLVGTLSTVSGGRFPPNFDPALIAEQAWGTVAFEASGCAEAELRWTAIDPAYGSGVLPLVRLTRLQGQRCNAEEEFGEQRIFSFERGAQGFAPLFADLPATGQDIYELDFAWEPLPAPLQARRGLRLSGHNRSDDLAMLIKAPLAGLQPDAPYRIELELELASNVPTGCIGIGGSPGDSVYLKLGASPVEPLAPAQDEGGVPTLRLNIDFGNQAEGGSDARVVGTLANDYDCADGSNAPWQLKTLDTGGQTFTARAGADGRLWIVAGTDSAFEGKTDVYFTALRVRLEPAAAQ